MELRSKNLAEIPLTRKDNRDFPNPGILRQFLRKTAKPSLSGKPDISDLVSLEDLTGTIFYDWIQILYPGDEAAGWFYEANNAFEGKSPAEMVSVDWLRDCERLLGNVHLLRERFTAAIAGFAGVGQQFKDEYDEFEPELYRRLVTVQSEKAILDTYRRLDKSKIL